MLSNQHFYHKIIRKMVVSFGTMFNNVRLVRYNKAGTIEIERITVPLAYADKEKFYKRITQDPELTKEVAITLPRMGFTLDSITYDPLRKTSLYNKQFAPNNVTGELKSTQATPYNFDFTLSVYVRNVEDGTQIVEQILPYFNPDYTLSIDVTGLPGNKVDVPIILNSVNQNSQSDGVPDSTRVITWDLNFTMKGYLYGPVATSKLIRKATTNTFIYNTSTMGVKELYLNNGFGNYKIGEMVFEGRTLGSANSTAYVESWNNELNILKVVDVNGIIKPGNILRGAVTGSYWNISSFAEADYKIKSISIEPNPNTANPGDDFGFTTTTIDYTANTIDTQQFSNSPLEFFNVDGGGANTAFTENISG